MKAICPVVVFLCILASAAIPTRADIIFGNLAGYNNDGGATTIFSVGGKEIGFTTGSNYYAMSDVQIQLKVGSSGFVPQVSLYQGGTVGSSPTPPSGSALATSATPNGGFVYGSTVTYTFPLAYLLAPNTTYWIVVQGAGSGGTSISWPSGNPNVTFTGADLQSSSAFGALYNISSATSPTTWTSKSTVWNWLEVDGAVPPNLVTSWLGNTSAYLAFTQDIDAMFVKGTDIYTNTRWDEQGCEIQHLTTTGTTVAIADPAADHWYTHNDSYGDTGGIAITANSQYVFAGKGMRYTSYNTNYVSSGYEAAVVARYSRTGSLTPFTTGTTTLPRAIGWNGGPTYMLELRQVPETDPADGKALGGLSERSGGAGDEILGLAATDTLTDGHAHLYICDLGGQYNSTSDNPVIRVYDAATMAPLNISTGTNTWSVSRPGPLCLDGGNNLWMIQPAVSGSAADVIEFNPSTGAATATITFASTVFPGAMAYRTSGNQLLVADYGPDQNIKAYNLSSLSGSPTTIAGTIGNLGGLGTEGDTISGTIGQIQPLGFNCPSALGVDGSGNIVVAQNGQGPTMDRLYSGIVTGGQDEYCNYDIGNSTTLQSLTSSSGSWTVGWTQRGLLFCDVAGSPPSSDANADTDVYTGDKHFTIDYTQPPGQQWTFADYTANPSLYPDDYRFNTNNVYLTDTTWIREHSVTTGTVTQTYKYMYLLDQLSHYVPFYYFSGQNTVPCGLYAYGNSTGTSTPPNPSWPTGHPTANTHEWLWTYNPSLHSGSGPIVPMAAEYSQNSSSSYTNVTPARWVDANCGLWEGMNGQPLRVLHPAWSSDPTPIPQYSWSNASTYSYNSIATNLIHFDRIQYDAVNDIMYIAGWATGETTVDGTFPHIWKITGFTAGTGTYTMTPGSFPIYQPGGGSNLAANTQPQSFCVEGNYLFLLYGSAVPYIEIYQTGNMAYVDTIHPGAATDWASGYPDDVYAIGAHQRANGQYTIFTEDNQYTRNMMYEWTPNLVNVPTGTYTLSCSAAATEGKYFLESHTGTYSPAYAVTEELTDSGTDQQWVVSDLGNGTSSIVNVATNAALELGSDGKTVFAQNPYSSSNPNQQWQVRATTSNTSNCSIVNATTATALNKATVEEPEYWTYPPGSGPGSALTTTIYDLQEHLGESFDFAPVP